MQGCEVFDLYLKAQLDLHQNIRICFMHIITILQQRIISRVNAAEGFYEVYLDVLYLYETSFLYDLSTNNANAIIFG